MLERLDESLERFEAAAANSLGLPAGGALPRKRATLHKQPLEAAVCPPAPLPPPPPPPSAPIPPFDSNSCGRCCNNAR